MTKLKIRLGSRTLIILLVSFVSLTAAVASGETRRGSPFPSCCRLRQAEKFMSYNVPRWCFAPASARPGSGRPLLVRNAIEKEGSEFILVDPARGRGRRPSITPKSPRRSPRPRGKPMTRPIFPSRRSISRRTADDLVRWPRPALVVRPAGQGLQSRRGRRGPYPRKAARRGRRWRGERPEVLSPDGRLAAFIRDDNLWVRDVATGAEKQLTTDGVKDFGYATDNAGWTKQRPAGRPLVAGLEEDRAPSSRTSAGSARCTSSNTKVGHPVLQAWKYPLPGDEVVTMIQRVVIDVDGPRVVRLKMPPDQHRSHAHATTSSARGGELDDAVEPGRLASSAFVSTSRDHKQARLRVADAADGRGPRRVRGEGRDVLRVRQRQLQLALSCRLERGHLVLRARQLGPALSLRPADRQAEEPDHDRRGERHAVAAGRREGPDALLPGRAAGRRAAIRTSATSTASGSTAANSRC